MSEVTLADFDPVFGHVEPCAKIGCACASVLYDLAAALGAERDALRESGWRRWLTSGSAWPLIALGNPDAVPSGRRAPDNSAHC